MNKLIGWNDLRKELERMSYYTSNPDLHEACEYALQNWFEQEPIDNSNEVTQEIILEKKS